MTDRELLELAAKAAGVTGFWVDSGLNTGSNANPRTWNSLTDDGDALRLAVTLRIGVQSYPGLGHSHAGTETAEKSIVVKEPHGADPYAATRRAITRAAAEIGKAMP